MKETSHKHWGCSAALAQATLAAPGDEAIRAKHVSAFHVGALGCLSLSWPLCPWEQLNVQLRFGTADWLNIPESLKLLNVKMIFP